MSPLISLVAAAAVLLHSLLGCCLHHEHRCGEELGAAVQSARHSGDERHTHTCSTRAGQPNRGAHAARESGSHHDGQPCSEPQPEPHECDAGGCSFLSSAVASGVVRAELLAFWMAAESMLSAHPLGPFCGIAKRVADRRAARPERWQARLGVWLI